MFRLALLGLSLASLAACAPSTYPSPKVAAYAASRAERPWGENEHLARSAVDPAWLGSILPEPYDPARPLAAQLAPNPCAEALAELPEDRAARAVEEVQEGLYYRAQITRRVQKVATREYATCCTQKACGEGFLSALSRGTGDLATAVPTRAGGRADVAFEQETDASVHEYTLSATRPLAGVVSFTLSRGTEQAPTLATAKPEPHDDSLEIRPRRENPDYFEYCNRFGCITENEFVRRYEKLTGSRELHAYLRDREPEIHAVGVAAGIMSVGTLVAGGILSGLAGSRDTEKKKDDYNAGGAALAGMGAGLFALALPFLFTPYDGRTTANLLSKQQAQRFVARYNRALALRSP